jgi:cytochrome b
MALGPGKNTLRLPMRIWDAPTRLFHWALVVGLAACYVTDKLGVFWLHMICGEAVLALLLFRIVWGFIGSDTARFGHFLGSPFAALRHLAQFGRRGPDDQVGHNEAGGWMVLVMIVILLAQVGTGLFINDVDSFIAGPLAHLISEDTGEQMLRLHDLNFTLIKIAVVLHIIAIIAYAAVKRHDLVRPMITGKKRLPAATRAPRMASPALALAVLAVAAALVAAVVTQLGK